MERPPAVARFRRARLWILGWSVVAAALGVSYGVATSHVAGVDDTHVEVDGTVLRLPTSAANPKYLVRYRHPVTHQVVRRDVSVAEASKRPAGLGPVRLLVSLDDPRSVRVPGDRYPWTDDAIWWAMVVAGAALPSIFRVVTVWRSSRLAASARPTFAMRGALSPGRVRTSHVVLHLYPLDAPPGSMPVASVPLVTSGQLPVGCGTFPVEVKGKPRPAGRVIARADDRVLWPARRALRTTSFARPDDELEPPFGLRAAAVAGSRPSWVAAEGIGALCLVGAILFWLVSFAYVQHRSDEVTDLSRRGPLVVGRVLGGGSGDATAVRLAYEVQGVRHVATAGVDFPEDYPEGMRFPMHVFAGDPRHARLPAEPYDGREPLIWASLVPGSAAAWLTVRALQLRRRRQVAARGPWWEAPVRTVGDETLVVDDGRRPLARLPEPAPAPHVVLAGELAPGTPVVVWDQFGRVTAQGSAMAPVDPPPDRRERWSTWWARRRWWPWA